MAAKRLHDQSDSDPDEQENKRIETDGASCISTLRSNIAMIRSLHEPLSALLEPLLRKVVREEAEDVVSRLASKFSRSSSLQIRSASDEASTWKLIFTKSLLLPIFTNSKIVDLDRSPLQVHLINTDAHGQVYPPSPIKLEIVALDGDFPGSDNMDWTSEEFDDHILKARENKRPLLTGDVSVTLRNGKAELGDLELTDNSSWVRSRHFRIGARVISAGSFPKRIKEAITGPFQVRDHRGESYKKHFPPSLTDEVWRLKNISRDGVFHNKLNEKGIINVQGFVQQLHLNLPRLKGILAMSEKLWDATVKHSLTCQMGSKRYIYHAHDSTLLLSPTCQVLAASVNGKFYNQSAITGREMKAYVQEMTKRAIMQWDQLQEVDEQVDAITILSRYVDHANIASSSAGANTGQASLHGYGNIGIEFSTPANNQQLWEGGEESIQPIHPMGVDSQFGTMDEDSYGFAPPDFNYQNNL